MFFCTIYVINVFYFLLKYLCPYFYSTFLIFAFLSDLMNKKNTILENSISDRYTYFNSFFSSSFCYFNKNDKEPSNRRKPTSYECLFPISTVKSIFNVHVQTGSSTFLCSARAVAEELSILYLTLTRNGLKGNSPRKIHKKDRLRRPRRPESDPRQRRRIRWKIGYFTIFLYLYRGNQNKINVLFFSFKYCVQLEILMN